MSKLVVYAEAFPTVYFEANVPFPSSIVALHGLSGHAWNSFSTPVSVDHQAKRTKDVNWLRDILPQLLETNTQQKIYPRVMTYGYNADVWMTKSVQEIDVPVNNLLSCLSTERDQVSQAMTSCIIPANLQKDPERPLFFVGHSLGGIVLQQVCTAGTHLLMGVSTSTLG